MPQTFVKDPAATGTYLIDWSADFGPGAALSQSAWELPDDLTEIDSDKTGLTTTITIGAGVAGYEYTVYNQVVTDGGLIGRKAILLQVVDAGEIHEPTELEKQLAAVRVALGQKAAKDVQEYQIANRMKQMHTFEDLLAWEKRLTELVSQERRTVGGAGFFKNHFVRPTEPGP